MSMGAKMRAAFLVLKDEDRLYPGIRTNELEKRLAEKLTELGCGPGEIPSHRTFLRHLDDLRALMQPADGTLCHYRDAATDGMVAADDPAHEKEQGDMHASNHQTMISTTGYANTWAQSVPWDHPLEEVLAPGYLDGNYLKFKVGDRVELQASDWAWICCFLVVSVNKPAR